VLAARPRAFACARPLQSDTKAEAAPKYLGVTFPQTSWPTGARTRPGTLTETEATHWPGSLRRLAQAGDERLPAVAAAAEAL
jgi:hypothetical protein